MKAKEKGDGKSSTGSMKLSVVIAGMSVLLVSVAMAFTSLAVIPVVAQESEVTVTVNAPPVVEKGGTFVATIDVDSVTDLNSAQFDLSFDPDVIEVKDVEDGEIKGKKVPIMWDPIDAGTVGVLVMPMGEDVSGSGYLAEVEFKVNGDEGYMSVLDISNGMLIDKNGASEELFIIDKKFMYELNGEEISDDLKDAFEEKGEEYRLENPTVKVLKKDKSWEIIDFPKRVYWVITESGFLSVGETAEILANWIDAEIRIGVKEEEEEEEEDADEEVTPGSPNITACKPAEAVVSNAVGESRAFNITVSQIAAISWQINGTEVQTNESTREAVFTKGADIGTWNVSVIATNTTTGLSSDMHTWIWSVTLTPTATATVTPTPTLAPGVTPTPTLAPGETPKPTPTPTLAPRVTPKPTTPTPTPKPAGFEAMFAIVGTLAVAYILLRKR